MGPVGRGQIVFVVGARPNFMKVAPVYSAVARLELDRELLLVHTGQHYDAEMSDVFLNELQLPQPSAFLAVGSGTHAAQTAAVLLGMERVLAELDAELVVVAGDVNSTLGAALAAAQLGIPCAHVEAGLRNFDPTMPEELNRRLTDQMSAVLLTHSPEAEANLEREGIERRRIHLVGNTMIDSLFEHVEAARAAAPWAQFGVERGEYALVTLHRPELVNDDRVLGAVARQIAALAETIPLVFPVHPRTMNRLQAIDALETLEASDVRLTSPLAYSTFLGLEAEAAFVLTDSGGIQEETSALGVRCFTLRASTERPITVRLGTNELLGVDPAAIAEIPARLSRLRRPLPIPLWDGRAGERTAVVLSDFLGEALGSRVAAATARSLP